MQQAIVIMCHMNTVSDVIQQVIKDVRKQTGWTQAQLAQKLGKDPSWVSRWEKGIPKEMPPPEDFRAICLISGVSMRTLIERIGYLDSEELEPGVSYVLRSDDPRSRLLDMLAGLSPVGIDNVRRMVSTLVDVTGADARIDRASDPMEIEPGA